MGLYAYDSEINTGLAQDGGSNTIRLANTASNSDDYYNGCSVTITGGKGSGQRRIIIDYIGNTRTAIVSPDWATIPDTTSSYSVKMYPAWANGESVLSAERMAHIESDGCAAAHSELEAHKGSGDHDSRYEQLFDIVTTPTANRVLRLDANAKYPNTALYTGSGGGLDADSVDGCHAGGNTAGRLLQLDSNGLVPLGNIPATLTGKNADTVDGCHAGTSANNVLRLDSNGLVPSSAYPKVASDNLRNSHDTSVETFARSYTKVKSIVFSSGISGTIRVKIGVFFQRRATNYHDTGYWRVYVNGSPTGSEHSVGLYASGGGWNTTSSSSDDIVVNSGGGPGLSVEVWAYSTGDNNNYDNPSITITSFGVCYDNTTLVVVPGTGTTP